jgi:hypothetical protein
MPHDEMYFADSSRGFSKEKRAHHIEIEAVGAIIANDRTWGWDPAARLARLGGEILETRN